jgi:hypothetical protein
MKQRLLTVNERIHQWKSLSELMKRIPQSPKEDDEVDEEEDDPFDCSDLIVPPTFELVQNVLSEHMKDWEELDSRVIVTDKPMGNNNRKREGRGLNQGKVCEENLDNGSDAKNNQIEEHLCQEVGNEEKDVEITEEQIIGSGDYAGVNWGWHANRIRLPDYFDYACRGEPPQLPVTAEQRSRRRQVISLEDPTQLLDYETELWKLFNNVPIAEEIENEAIEGSICRKTIRVRNEIEEGLKEYTRLDGHSLNRLRKRERHHWPRINQIKKKNQPDSGGLGDICGATITIECWRRQLKRGSGCDSNRCEMEFIESQTLLDLHNLIVHCSQDDLFNYGMCKQKSSQDNEASTEISDEVHSSRGYFFIENTFYTHGDVDYISPILKWLDEEVLYTPNNNSQEESRKKRKYMKKAPPTVLRCRKEFLGIQKNVNLKVVPMKNVKLSEIRFKLACRYVHVFNGDCESTLFFSDVCMRMSNENISVSQYPLIHDIFTTTTSMTTIQESSICQGCERGSVIVMTLNDEMTDGGPTLLCPVCYAKLHYNAEGTDLLYNNFQVVPISVLQNLRDLSVGNDTTEALF